MGNNGFDGYQSGGKSYTSPNKAIENSIFREAKKEMGGDLGALDTMPVQESLKILENVIRESAANSQATNEQVEGIIARLSEYSQQFDNARQFMHSGTTALGKEYARNLEMMKGLQVQRGTDTKNSGILGRVNNNPMMQLIHTNQEILNRLNEMNVILTDTNGDMNRNQNEEEGLFDSLRQTIVHSVLNSPTANKLGKLGASLISAGLFRIASNEKMPTWARQMAMGAVYFEIPQTLMNIIGGVTQTALTAWLLGSGKGIFGNFLGGIASKATGAISGFMGNVMGFMSRLLPMAVPLIAGALIVGGIIALIKGVADHHKKMKENDAKIDRDPKLTQGQKDIKKLKAHSASGAKVGMISGGLIGAGAGALKGAAIGSVIPGVGTAAGAIVGGVIGGIGGLLAGGLGGAIIGALKPLGQGIKHLGQNIGKGFSSWWSKTSEHFKNLGPALKQMGQNTMKGLRQVGAHILSGAKWAAEHKNQFMQVLKPIFQVLKTLFELCNPFFLLFRVFSNKILNSPLGKMLLGRSDNEGIGDEGTQTVGGKIKSAVTTTANYVATGLGLGGTVKMADLGLKGTISSGNSVPATLKKNAYNVQQLDHILASWGYDVTYTSNMGGQHKTGEKSHASGNKVDLQLFRGGKVTHLTGEQLAYLKNLGYWGGNTGALGWEVVNGQVGGGHYDLHIGNQVKADTTDQQLVALRKKAEDAANEEKRKKEEEQKAKEEEKNKFEKEHPTIAKVNNAVESTVKTAAFNVAKGLMDFTGMDNYTKEQNTTNTMVNRGQ